MLAIMFHRCFDRDLFGRLYFDRNAKAQENNLSPDKTPLGVCDQWVLLLKTNTLGKNKTKQLYTFTTILKIYPT